MSKNNIVEFPRFVRFVGLINDKGNQLAIVSLKGTEFEVEILRDPMGKWVCQLGQSRYRMSIRKVKNEEDKSKPGISPAG